MTPKQIKNLCIKQSKSYLGYIKTYNENGTKSVDKIRSLRLLDLDDTYELCLHKKIFDFDRCYILDIKNNREYHFNKDIKVKAYDEVTKRLYVLQLNEKHTWNELTQKDLLLVSDLSFLINNVIDWYEVHGEDLHLHKEASSHVAQIRNHGDMVLNSEQEEALKTIHTYPQSYIWGPPGTGKTKAVLAQSILSYMELDKRVLILAPTNIFLHVFM